MKRASNAAASDDAQDGAMVAPHGRAPANETDNPSRRTEALTPARRMELTLGHLRAIRALWPDLVALTDDQRSRSSGRHVTRYADAFQTLFAVAGREPWAAAFALLSDEGDGARFDAVAHVENFERLAALRAVSDEMKKLGALVDDDLLHTGERVVGPGLRALDLARTLARNNKRFRALVAPALNAVGAMTAKARRVLAEAPEADEKPAPA